MPLPFGYSRLCYNRLRFVLLLGSLCSWGHYRALHGDYELPRGITVKEHDWQLIVDFLRHKKFPRHHALIDKSKLACPIEYDPESEKVYVHLSHLPGAYIGKGAHKVVTKAILFSKSPKIVAHCEGDASTVEEAKVWKKLSGLPGIVKLYSAVKRSSTRVALFTEFFNSGTLKKIFDNFPQLDEQAILNIAYDLLHGLKSLHDNGYVHRDLHRGNLLLHKEKNGRLKAAIVDLGKVIKADNRSSVVTFGINCCPPEAFLHSPANIDRLLVDTYLLGSALYFLATGELVEWKHAFNQFKLNELSLNERRQIHRKICVQYTEYVRKVSKASKSRALASIAIKMLNPKPKTRMDLKQARLEIKQLLVQLKGC